MNGDMLIPARDLHSHQQHGYGPNDLGSPVRLLDDRGRFSAPFALIRLIVVAIAPFVLVDAALYQVQMFVTGGATPVTPAILKIGLLCVFAAAFLLRGKISDQPVLKIALIFVAYLVVDALHQYFNLGLEFTDILLSYNAYYLLPLIGVVALATPVRISDRLLTTMVIALALICGALGLAQYLTNTPIVPTQSSDGYFRVMVWSTLGRIRVFSLFVAPATCAQFFCFVASLAVAMSRRRQNLIVAVPLLLLSLFMTWVSGARTAIAGTMCGLITSWIITFSGRKRFTQWLPFLWLLFGLVIASYAYVQTGSGGLSTGSMTDAGSFAERFATWSRIIDMFRSTSAFNILVGYGMVQGARLDPTGTSGSDNLYLSLILHIGVIGLCLMMLLLWQLWQSVRKQAEAGTSYLITAVAATYSTLLLTGIFDLSTFGMMFLFFAISDKSSPLKHGETTSYAQTDAHGRLSVSNNEHSRSDSPGTSPRDLPSPHF